jgi:hypothetical protein
MASSISTSHGGFVTLEATLGGKWLELLAEIAPGLKRAAIMFNTDTAAASAYTPSFETAARLLKVVPIDAPVHSAAASAGPACARFRARSRSIAATIRSAWRSGAGPIALITIGLSMAMVLR